MIRAGHRVSAARGWAQSVSQELNGAYGPELVPGFIPLRRPLRNRQRAATPRAWPQRSGDEIHRTMCEGRIDEPWLSRLRPAAEHNFFFFFCVCEHTHTHTQAHVCAPPRLWHPPSPLYPRERTAQRVEHRFATGGFHGFLGVDHIWRPIEYMM